MEEIGVNQIMMLKDNEKLSEEELVDEFYDAVITGMRPNAEQRLEIIHGKYRTKIKMGCYDAHPRIAEAREQIEREENNNLRER